MLLQSVHKFDEFLNIDTMEPITNSPVQVVDVDEWENAFASAEECQRQPGLNYKEYLDKTYTESEKAYVAAAPGIVWKALHTCHNSAITGTCSHGHAYAKVIDCGKDSCPRCGQKDSNTHKQRQARLFKKAFKMDAIGYFVIQWPIESRKNLRTKKELSEVGTKITRLMKRLGYNRGYRAWHYFGDPRCPHGCQDNGKNGKNLPKEVDSMHYECPVCETTFHINDSHIKWNPHLNILVDAEFIDPEKLEKIKKRFKNTLDEPNLIVNYEYAKSDEIAKKVHFIKYITRATFKSYAWDLEMVQELHKFRGLTSWGSKDEWAGEKKWTLEEGNGETSDLIHLEDNKCLECGEHITWYPSVYSMEKLCVEWVVDELAAGYLRLGRIDRSGTMPKVSRYADVSEGAISAEEYLEWKQSIEDKLWGHETADDIDRASARKERYETQYLLY